MKLDDFKTINIQAESFPRTPGLYCVRVENGNFIKKNFLVDVAKEYSGRKNEILYIGKASDSLRRRLSQELLGRGHGTFFRSIGAALGYLPPMGTLSRGCNYKFSESDKKKIIDWIVSNLTLSYINGVNELEVKEKILIDIHKPFINIKGNKDYSIAVKRQREKCLKIARGEIIN